MKLSDIKPNPNNPRVIKDEKFIKLKKINRGVSKNDETSPDDNKR